MSKKLQKMSHTQCLLETEFLQIVVVSSLLEQGLGFGKMY